MGVQQRITSDPLAGGFYTVSEAARFIRMNNYNRVYGWLAGYANSMSGPVITRDYEPIAGAHGVSFWDLMEIRFIEHFRNQDVSLQTLRLVAMKARKRFRTKHPLALSNIKFLTDRKEIFQVSAEETGDTTTLNMVRDQYEMYEVIETLLAKGVAFDPETHLAMEWRPLRNDCPNVIMNPKYAYGHPVVGDNCVPTAALYRLWRAEYGDKQRVADWFHVDLDSVDEAVEFEVRLAA